MATINIANLTFTHKGNYDGSTAYVKNDVVYYATNGNAYIAKQGTTGNVPTNGTYWSQFAAGSGGIWNAGLSLGSAGQAVKVNAAGNALEFGSAGGLVLLKTTAITSGVAQVDFNSTYINSSFNNYKMILRGISTSSDNQDLYVKMSVDNGSNFITMVGVRQNTQINNGSQSFGGTGNLSGGIPLGSDEESDDDDQINGEITFYDLNANNNYKFGTGRATVVNQNGDLYSYVISGYGVSTSAVNLLRVYTLTGGNLDDGSISLYGFQE